MRATVTAATDNAVAAVPGRCRARARTAARTAAEPGHARRTRHGISGSCPLLRDRSPVRIKSAQGVRRACVPAAYGRRVMSSSPETPTHTTGAHRAHRRAPRGRAHARSRPRATSRTWTACSPTACPCCATTTRRPRCSATSSPSPSARARPGGARTAGPGCTPSPAGPACASSPTRRSRQGAHAGRPAASEERPRVSDGGRGAPPPRTRPAGLAGGRRHHARAARGARTGRAPPARRARGRRRPRHGPGRRPRTARLGRLRGRAHPRGPRRRRDRRLPGGRPAHRRQPAAALRGPAPRTGPARRRLPALPPYRRAGRRRRAWPGASRQPAALPVLEAPRAAPHMAMAHVPRARGRPHRASTGAASRWTPRTARPAGTGSGRVPSPPPSSPPSWPRPCSPCGRPTAARP